MRTCLDDEPRADARDALVVQRVHARVGRAARDPLQQSVRRELHDVRGTVLPFERIVEPFAVIVEAGRRVQPLMQRAAIGDVQLLHAAADREHRHAGVDRRADQRQRGGIARAVVQGVARARRAAVVMRLDVRIAAGQQQSVDRRDDRVERLARTERGQHERERTGAVDERVEVLLAGRMVRVRTAHDAVGGDGYDRAGAHDRGSVVCTTNGCTQRDACAQASSACTQRRHGIRFGSQQEEDARATTTRCRRTAPR